MSDLGTGNGKRKQEEQLFRAALEHPSGPERQAFVERECAGDVRLRERLQALLDAHEDSNPALRSQAEDSPGVTIRLSLPQEEGLGTQIGRFKLLEKIGEGGFGEVYVAEQREPVKRKVALKIIKLGMDTRQVVARFEAERQALAMMDHPNIAKVLDGGATDSGRPYFVMELVRGVPITQYCDENLLGAEDRLKLFILVCHAVQHAHQKGIIHRDIKPSNILVTLHDGVPVPKVIDFGIAKATQVELTEKTIHTQFQQFIGTPAYVSPEQAEMSGLDIDTRSDIYSLGVLLYELLVGRTPFDPKEMLKAGLDSMRKTIREEEPARPSTRLVTLQGSERTATAKRRRTADVTKLAATLRGEVDWIVMKCLEKDRTRRYETASGLAMDLQRYLAQEAVEARPPSRVYRFQKAWRRNRLAFTAGAVVAAALVLGIGMSTWQAVVATRAQREQVRLRTAAEYSAAQESKAKQVALEAKSHADEAAHRLRQQTYAAEMRIAQLALDSGNLKQCRALLLKYQPAPEAPEQEDLRGIEWRYLWQETRSQAVAELRAASSVTGLAVSSDDRLLATLEFPNRMVVRDAATGKVLHQQEAGGKERFDTGGIAFSPDSRTLAFCSADSIRAISVPTWDELYRHETTSPLDVAFSPDGNYLAAVSAFAPLKIWQLGSSTNGPFRRDPPFVSITNHNVVYPKLAWAPDCSLLYVGDDPRGVHAFDPATGALRLSFAEPVETTSIAASPDGKYLAAGDWQGNLLVWAARDGRLLERQRVTPSYLFGLAFSEDGHTLVTGGADQIVKFWGFSPDRDNSPTSSLVLLRQLRGHEDGVTSVKRVGNHYLSASWDGTLRTWRTNTPTDRLKSYRLPPSDTPMSCGILGESQDSSLTWALSSRHGFVAWDSKAAGNPLVHAQAPPGLDNFASDADLRDRVSRSLWHQGEIFYQSTDGYLCRFNPASRALSKSWHLGDTNLFLRSVLTNEGVTYIVTARFGVGNVSGETACRDLNSGNRATGPWADFLAQARPIDAPFKSTLLQSPDGMWVAQQDKDGMLGVWDVANQRTAVRISTGHLVGCLAFTPDGRHLAAGLLNNTARVWCIPSGTPLTPPLQGCLAPIYAVRFSADRRTLLVCSDDHSSRMYSLATGQEMVVLQDATIPRGGPIDDGVGLMLGSSFSTARVGYYPVPRLADIDAFLRKDKRAAEAAAPGTHWKLPELTGTQEQ